MGQVDGGKCSRCHRPKAWWSSVCIRHGAAAQLSHPVIQRARMRALSLEQLEEIIRDPRRAGGRRPSHSSNRWYTPEVIELHRFMASLEVLARTEREPALQTQFVAELIEDVKRETLEELL